MELIREIIVPTSNSYTLSLPDRLIGKKVEVMLAFETELITTELTKPKEKNIEEIRDIFRDNLIDLSNFKFDRDEANNYD